MRPSADNIFLPGFSQRIILQSGGEFFGIGPVELRSLAIPFDDYNNLCCKTIEERTGLRADEGLCMYWLIEAMKQPR